VNKPHDDPLMIGAWIGSHLVTKILVGTGSSVSERAIWPSLRQDGIGSTVSSCSGVLLIDKSPPSDPSFPLWKRLTSLLLFNTLWMSSGNS
jgi:hypothetical protein